MRIKQGFLCLYYQSKIILSPICKSICIVFCLSGLIVFSRHIHQQKYFTPRPLYPLYGIRATYFNHQSPIIHLIECPNNKQFAPYYSQNLAKYRFLLAEYLTFKLLFIINQKHLLEIALVFALKGLTNINFLFKHSHTNLPLCSICIISRNPPL